MSANAKNTNTPKSTRSNAVSAAQPSKSGATPARVNEAELTETVNFDFAQFAEAHGEAVHFYGFDVDRKSGNITANFRFANQKTQAMYHAICDKQMGYAPLVGKDCKIILDKEGDWVLAYPNHYSHPRMAKPELPEAVRQLVKLIRG